MAILVLVKLLTAVSGAEPRDEVIKKEKDEEDAERRSDRIFEIFEQGFGFCDLETLLFL